MRRLLIAVCAAAMAGSCRSTALTATEVAHLLKESSLLAGEETMTFSLPRGCFTIPADTNFKAGDLERDRQLSESAAMRQQLQRARELDLLDFEFAPVPATIAAPPLGCEELWASLRSGATGVDATRTQLVGWRTMMSDKALAAGLSPGQTFVYRRQTFVAIIGMSPRDADTVIVEYTWQWAPPLEAARLGVRPSAEMPAKAMVKRTADGWRIVS